MYEKNLAHDPHQKDVFRSAWMSLDEDRYGVL